MAEGMRRSRRRGVEKLAVSAGILAALVLCFGLKFGSATPLANENHKWEVIGQKAAEECLVLLKKTGTFSGKKNLIVLTNAGYAETNGEPTQGALDGLAHATGASRGRNTLVEVHAAAWDRLWVALYDRTSGYCAYMDISPGWTATMPKGAKRLPADAIGTRAVERIDAGYLAGHANEFIPKLQKKPFGGNEFRVVTIANAVAAGAPAAAVRAFEFHDHYCPGVTSGILMAGYLKRHFAAGPGGHYFVQALDPWCKEDALMVLLNATPGKRSYAVTYPSDADKARRLPEASDASTVVYRENPHTKKWDGLVLKFEWADTGCPKTENGLLDKLCTDLWYLQRMDRPEDFVKVIKTFDLPEGVSPRDWAGPGIDPMEQLHLLQPARQTEQKTTGS